MPKINSLEEALEYMSRDWNLFGATSAFPSLVKHIQERADSLHSYEEEVQKRLGTLEQELETRCRELPEEMRNVYQEILDEEKRDEALDKRFYLIKALFGSVESLKEERDRILETMQYCDQIDIFASQLLGPLNVYIEKEEEINELAKSKDIDPKIRDAYLLACDVATKFPLREKIVRESGLEKLFGVSKKRNAVYRPKRPRSVGLTHVSAIINSNIEDVLAKESKNFSEFLSEFEIENRGISSYQEWIARLSEIADSDSLEKYKKYCTTIEKAKDEQGKALSEVHIATKNFFTFLIEALE